MWEPRHWPFCTGGNIGIQQGPPVISPLEQMPGLVGSSDFMHSDRSPALCLPFSPWSLCSSFQLERAGGSGPGEVILTASRLTHLGPYAVLKPLNCQLIHTKSKVSLIQLGRKYEPWIKRHFPHTSPHTEINIFLHHTLLKLLKEAPAIFPCPGEEFYYKGGQNRPLKTPTRDGGRGGGKIVSSRCKIIDWEWPRQGEQLRPGQGGGGWQGVSATPFPSKVGNSVVKAIRWFEPWK